MGSSPSATAKQRLREQVRREQGLVDAVLAAEGRLATEIDKRDAAIAIHDAAVDARRHTLAEAIAAYLHDAGVSVARAAAVFDRPEHEITRLLRHLRRSDAETNARTDNSADDACMETAGGINNASGVELTNGANEGDTR